MSLHRTRRLTRASLLLGIGLSLAPASLSLAHSEVASTIPAEGEEITENPVEVTVVTAQPLLDLGGTAAGFALVIQDAEGLYYGDGCVSVRENSLSAVAELGEPGAYVVTYQYVSADGHSVSGSFSFTLADSATGAATGQPSAPLCGAGEGVTSTQTESTEPSPTMSVAVVAGGLTLGAVVALLWMRRKKNRAS